MQQQQQILSNPQLAEQIARYNTTVANNTGIPTNQLYNHYLELVNKSPSQQAPALQNPPPASPQVRRRHAYCEMRALVRLLLVDVCLCFATADDVIGLAGVATSLPVGGAGRADRQQPRHGADTGLRQRSHRSGQPAAVARRRDRAPRQERYSCVNRCSTLWLQSQQQPPNRKRQSCEACKVFLAFM